MALYTVQQGDSLSKIALMYYGDAAEYPQLLDLNPQITNPNLIRVGDILNVPDSAGSSSDTSSTTSVDTPKANINSQIVTVALLAGLAAVLYKSYMSKPAVAANPEEDEEEPEEEEMIDEGEDDAEG